MVGDWLWPDLLSNLLMNVLSGLVGALILALLTALLSRVRNYGIERLHPLAGEYISRYELLDENDQMILAKATATFRQKGQRITGETTSLYDGYTWELDLSLQHGRHLVGTYTSKKPEVVSLGVILLERHTSDPNQLTGLWAGYNPNTNRIESGKYIFTRQIQPKVRPLKQRDTTPALALLARALGDQYLTRSDLTAHIQSPANQGYVALQNEKLCGVSLVELLEPREFATHFGARAELLADLIPGFYHQRIGFIKSIAVDEVAKGKGVGSALLKPSVKWLKDQGATCMLAIAWESGGRCFAAGVLESAGLKQIGHIERFWHEESKEQGYKCPTCGNPCLCGAYVYLRT